MPVAWVFPGQGSQVKGMGADLFDRYPGAVAEADAILGFSVRDVCAAGGRQLQRTEFLQPVMFVVTALHLRARQELGGRPDVLAGHSLGEYAALLAAGCIDFATGVRLTRRRGELMAAAGDGAMLAVLGVPAAELADLVARTGAADVDVANQNSPTQTVLAGSRASLALVTDAVRDAGAGRCVPLGVSIAAHSRAMRGVAEEFAGVLAGVPFAPPAVPVVANVTARPYGPGEFVDLLTRHLYCPVRWWDTMCRLAREGVGEVEEIGPGDVLSKLWTRHRTDLPAPAPTPPAPPAAAPVGRAEALGSARFRADHGSRLACVAGGTARGVSSAALVTRLAGAGLFGYLGADGLPADTLARELAVLDRDAGPGRYGVALRAAGAAADRLVDLLLDRGVRHLEVSGPGVLSAAVVRFRFTGAGPGPDGRPAAPRRVLVRVADPRLGTALLEPPPEPLLADLVARGALTATEAAAARRLPVCTDLCPDAAPDPWADPVPGPEMPALAALPALLAARDAATGRHGYADPPRVGAAESTVPAVAAALVCGAEFVVLGAVLATTAQAGLPAAVKDRLAAAGPGDTADVPVLTAGGRVARRHVLARGTLFPARVRALHRAVREGVAPADLPPPARVAADLDPAAADGALTGALLRYQERALEWARTGEPGRDLDHCVPCDPATAAFTAWAREAGLNGDVAAVVEAVMTGAADLLTDRLTALTGA